MATKKIRNLDNTATIPASDDYDVIDGEVNGTRKILSSAREYVANKEQTALDTSFTKYPCNNVVKSALDLKATSTDLVSHTTNVSNPHNTTATQVGAPTISSGIVAPASTPAKIGDMYVNTVLKQTYVANGTSSSANWVEEDYNARLQADRLYDGVDLSTKFATEIAGYTDVWAWIKARTQAGNFNGIHIGDYIPFALNAGTVTDGTTPYIFTAQDMQAQIAGIDTYYGFGDTVIGHHIDFITKTVLDAPIPFQPVSNNNGTTASGNPWLTSKAFSILNGINNYTTSAYNSVAHGYAVTSGSVLSLLPPGLQNVIVAKRTLSESRYSASGLLTASTTTLWVSTNNKLWLPSEFEIYGSSIYSTNPYANTNAVQYPLFAGNAGYKSRVKTNSIGTRETWWLSNASSVDSTSFIRISEAGSCSLYTAAANILYMPVCFRIS